jgi:4'-phosphopantetheinyl transferase
VISQASVFLFNTLEYHDLMEDLFSVLAKDEVLRSRNYTHDEHKTRYIICRGILRCIISRFTGIPPAGISFTYNAYGKPEIRAQQNPEGIRFNLSHAGEYGLIALGRDGEIGADLEIIRPMDTMPNIVDRFFTPAEKDILKSIRHKRQKHEAFFRWWVQKEAILKAQGRGISHGFTGFELDFLKPRYTLGFAHTSAKIYTNILNNNLIFCLCILRGT